MMTGRQEKTQNIIDQAHDILAAFHPMTLRQVYYQLVSRQVIKNSVSSYHAVSKALIDARLEGIIPWRWIEDRLRRPRSVPMWDDLVDFAEAALNSYRRDVWATQTHYLEVWLEKDALSGIFEDVLEEYGVTLNVGRGYDGWSSLYNAAERFQECSERPVRYAVTVLYFGDFDPSGEDMVRSLRDRLAILRSEPEIIKAALTVDDIVQYSLPSDFTKTTDTRSQAHIAKHGDVAVELDALPVDILRTRLTDAIEQRMDLTALQVVKDLEASERLKLIEALQYIQGEEEV